MTLSLPNDATDELKDGRAILQKGFPQGDVSTGQ